MSRAKVLIIILIAAVLAGLGFIYKNQVLDLIFGRFLKSPEIGTQKINEPIQTDKVNTGNLTLPENFPVKFPSLAGFDIVESYNLINLKTGKVKEATIVLTGDKSLTEIKNFYTEKLNPPDYIFVENSDKADSDMSKTLVFTTPSGLLIIRMEKEGADSMITISSDILVF